jgi:hypothetical protein
MKNTDNKPQDEPENPTYWPGDDRHDGGEKIKRDQSKKLVDPGIDEETKIPIVR